MKKIIFILLTVSLFSCSTGSEEPEEIIDEGNTSGQIVEEWNEESFIFDRFYSLVDTIGVVECNPSVVIKYKEGGNISISWYINNKPVNNTDIHKEWKADLKLWLLENEPVLSEALTYGDYIKSVVKIDNTTYTREATIKTNKIVSDVLAVTFGMSKEVVESNERIRMEQYTTLYGTSWREYLPNIAVMWYSTNIQDGITIYRFSNDKLTGVGEYTTNLEYTEELEKYCISLGLKEVPTITEGKLDKSYVWNNGKMEFELSIIEDAPILGAYGLCNALGITYRKL
jgi:hypothetical protein